MKRSNLLLIFSFICLTIISCTESKNNKMIQGNWQGVQWTVNGQPSAHDPQQASFSFDDRSKYSFNYADTKEKGTYKVENDMLFTTPENKIEIMVKIMKLTKDSLVFDMNNGGDSEVLTLLKK